MVRSIYALMAGVSLLICLLSPFLYLWQAVSDAAYKNILLGASLAWFVFATSFQLSRAAKP